MSGNQNLKNSQNSSEIRNVSFKEVKLATKLVWSFTPHGRRCTGVEQMLGVCPGQTRCMVILEPFGNADKTIEEEPVLHSHPDVSF